MHANYHQTLILVFLSPGANIGNRAKPIDTSIGPEVDENDFAAQAGCRKRRRVEPLGRTAEGGQLTFDGHRIVLGRSPDCGPDCAGKDRGEQDLNPFHDDLLSMRFEQPAT